MNVYLSIPSTLGNWQREYSYRNIYKQFRDFTMIPATSYKGNLLLAESIRDIPGCVVECGVWRGGMIAGIAALLGSTREYFLFDSFEGLPPAQAIDGKAALAWQQDTSSPNYYNNCSAPPEMAEKAMGMAKAKSFHLIKGWFDKTLPNFVFPQPIVLLRLDADWYDSTMLCLECLFDQMAPGGLILLDDYYAWDGCSRSLHDFLSRRSATERIYSLGDICYLIKRDSKK